MGIPHLAARRRITERRPIGVAITRCRVLEARKAALSKARVKLMKIYIQAEKVSTTATNQDGIAITDNISEDIVELNCY